MIKTVFFDIGDVILNEELLRFKNYEILWTHLRKVDARWDFSAIMEVREFLVTEMGDPNPHLTIAKKYLDEREYHKFMAHLRYFSQKYSYRYIRLTPGILPVIRNLYKSFNLGMIANQPRSVRYYLNRFHLPLYFRAIAISEELNLRKPEPEIFLWALDKTRSEPHEAIMVGDRLDHDIIPARKLGMFTIQAKFGVRVWGILPQQYREKLYFSSIEKVPHWPYKPRRKEELPDAVAETPDQILDIISQLQGPEPVVEKETEETVPSLWDILKELAEAASQES